MVVKKPAHRKDTGSGPEGYRKELKNEPLQVRVKCKDSYIPMLIPRPHPALFEGEDGGVDEPGAEIRRVEMSLGMSLEGDEPGG